MELHKALERSNCGIAEWFSPRAKKILVAMKIGAEVRIIESATDPTVVRRLRVNELESKDWCPWDAPPELRA